MIQRVRLGSEYFQGNETKGISGRLLYRMLKD